MTLDDSLNSDGMQPEDLERIFGKDYIRTVTFFSLGYMNTNEVKDGYYKLVKDDDVVWFNPETHQWYRVDIEEDRDDYIRRLPHSD